MKKTFLLLAAAALMFGIGCNKSKSTGESANQEEETVVPQSGRKCGAYEVLESQLKADPTLAARMEKIEEFTAEFAKNPIAGKLVNGVMEIPVVVNVLWNTAAQNITDQQIQSQITVLNKDFAGTNGDLYLTSTYNSVKAVGTPIHFTLQSVVRRQTSITSWSTNDAMKKTAQGGIDPTSPTTTLNMWACNLGNGLLGYAQFPGGSPSTDGVVILYSAFGSRAIHPAGTYVNTYDLGRTATHEVGHWFNLRHIWGDRRCGDDLVGDTPAHDAANYGCPAAGHPSRCSGKPIEMTMNYMDYTDDACMYMFTIAQATRMQATWAAGGPRASLVP
jgi:Pregnancy-associated plasma protein-A